MLQPCGNLHLPLEALGAERPRHVGREYLHHDAATEAPLGREEDMRHPPATQLAIDRVRAAERCLELVAKRVGHRVWSYGATVCTSTRDA